MSQCFPKPYEPFEGNINVKVDLFTYATKTDLKDISHVDLSSFTLKSNLANQKTVKSDVVRKTVYDKLVAKADNNDNTKFVLKATYDTHKSDLEKKISDANKKILIQMI